MSQLVRCPNNKHHYNPATHNTCPFCEMERIHPQHPQPGPNPPHPGPQPPYPGPNPPHPGTEMITQPPTAPGGGAATKIASPKTKIFGLKDDVDISQHLPVVGWLVVIEGPGKGTDFRLIQGDNRIGRLPDLEVPLMFGSKNDDSISRDAHAVVIYDPMSRRFYVNRSIGRNMPLLNGVSIMQLQELRANDIIQVGTTRLLFVPLCGENFTWSEENT